MDCFLFCFVESSSSRELSFLAEYRRCWGVGTWGEEMDGGVGFVMLVFVDERCEGEDKIGGREDDMFGFDGVSNFNLF